MRNSLRDTGANPIASRPVSRAAPPGRTESRTTFTAVLENTGPKELTDFAATHELDDFLNLYGDTLGPPGSPGATYIGMERWNMRAMVAGFLGTPPPQA